MFRFLLASMISCLLVLFLCRHCAVKGSGDYEMEYIPLGQDHVSTTTYSLSNLPFDEISSLWIRLQGKDPSAFIIMPDYEAEDFQCARLSTLPDLPSGFIRFVNGKPVDFIPIQSHGQDPLLFHLDFSAEHFARPKYALWLMSLPPANQITLLQRLRWSSVMGIECGFD